MLKRDFSSDVNTILSRDLINNMDHIYTWHRQNPLKMARLEFFLMSEELLTMIDSVYIKNGYRTAQCS